MELPFGVFFYEGPSGSVYPTFLSLRRQGGSRALGCTSWVRLRASLTCDLPRPGRPPCKTASECSKRYLPQTYKQDQAKDVYRHQYLLRNRLRNYLQFRRQNASARYPTRQQATMWKGQ